MSRGKKIIAVSTVALIATIVCLFPYRVLMSSSAVVASSRNGTVTVAYEIMGTNQICTLPVDIIDDDGRRYRVDDIVESLVFNQYHPSECLITGTMHSIAFYLQLFLFLVMIMCLSSLICYVVACRMLGLWSVATVAPVPLHAPDPEDIELASVTEISLSKLDTVCARTTEDVEDFMWRDDNIAVPEVTYVKSLIRCIGIMLIMMMLFYYGFQFKRPVLNSIKLEEVKVLGYSTYGTINSSRPERPVDPFCYLTVSYSFEAPLLDKWLSREQLLYYHCKPHFATGACLIGSGSGEDTTVLTIDEPSTRFLTYSVSYSGWRKIGHLRCYYDQQNYAASLLAALLVLAIIWLIDP